MLLGTRVAGGASAPAGVLSGTKNEELVPRTRTTADRVRKRSFKRALKRAEKQGSTMYKGKLLTSGTPELHHSPARQRSTKEWPRMDVASWNCSGLSQELFLEWQVWLRAKPNIAAFTLQETHWGMTSEWSTDEWIIVHSAAARPKQGGVMIGVRKNLVEANSSSWVAVEPGRILHWRGRIRQQQVDLVGVYQQALSFHSEEQKQGIMKYRKTVWNKLDKLLMALPFRTSIVLMGDLNLVLKPFGKVAGQGIYLGAEHLDQRQERDDVTQLLAKRRLSALNTWGKKQYTYKHPSGSSQIDYIFIRQQLADGRAKACCPQRAPIAGWRTAGHEVMIASLKISWRPWLQTTPRSQTVPQPAPLLSQITFMDKPQLAQLQQSIKQYHDVRPDKPPKPPMRSMQTEVLNVWRNLARARFRFNRNQTGRMFGAWQLALLKQKAQKEIRRLARMRKREQLLAILHSVEEAAKLGQARLQYQYIRMLAPAKSMGKICLRGDQGQLLDPEEESIQLRDYAKALFSGPHFEPPELEPLPEEWFTADQWQWAFKQIANNKAVPQDQAAIQAWKQQGDSTAPVLRKIALSTICSSTPTLPQEWTEVQLAWLPKPTKSPTRPENLRTIGLMGGDTKAFLQIIKHHANPYVQGALRTVPQYAYRAQASTSDALLRASQHCEAVRHQLQGCRDDMTAKLAGLSETLVVGGLMASLDLSKAFDSITHAEMYESLIYTGMPTHLAGTLLHIHIQTRLHILHKGHHHCVQMSKGLRQGCSVAPMIYAAWTCRLCHKLEQQLGPGWPQLHMTIFADDKHGFWNIRSAQDLTQARKQLGTLIGIITSMGMKVNGSKSRVVLALKGRLQQKLLSSCTKHWNGAKCIIIPCESGSIYIPIHQTLEYLGVKLSYGKYEVQAAQHRIQQAQIVYNQLKAPLRTNGPLSQDRRIRLYKACVLPSMLYGVCSVGCTMETIKLLASSISRHMRKICRIHEKGVTNQQVLDKAGILLYGDLERRSQTQLHSIQMDTHRSTALLERELKRAQHLHVQYLRVQEIGQTRADSLLLKILPDSLTLPCPVCGIYFGTQSGLHQHIHQKHPLLEQQARIEFDRAKHCLHGTPTCRFCKVRCSDWQSMRKHLTQGMCAVVKAAFAKGESLEDLIANIARDEQVCPTPPPVTTWRQDIPLGSSDHPILHVPDHQLPQHASFMLQFRAQCVLCNQRLVGAGHMKTHWRTGHPKAWRSAQYAAGTLAGSMSVTFNCPCQYCGSKAKDPKAHSRMCPSFFQITALRHLKQRNFSEEDYAYVQPKAAKQDKSNPQYISYVAPIQQALHAKVNSGSATTTASGADTTRCSIPLPAQQVPRSKQDGTIKCFFQRDKVVAPAPPPLEPPQEGPWQCRVKLLNPHNLCYVNAGFLAMTYAIDQAGIRPESLRQVLAMAHKAADRGVTLRLTQSNRFRQLAPHWIYDEVQRDTAEYMQQLLQAQGFHSVQWDSRRFGLAGLQVRAQGDLPIPMPIPRDATDLQDVIQHWNIHSDIHALAHETQCVCIQLNRFLRLGHTRKLLKAIRFDRTVYMPRFLEHIRVTWDSFAVIAAIIHLGRTTQSGHYRALLKVGAQWMYTDDSCYSCPVELSREHESNVYLLWLKRC